MRIEYLNILSVSTGTLEGLALIVGCATNAKMQDKASPPKMGPSQGARVPIL